MKTMLAAAALLAAISATPSRSADINASSKFWGGTNIYLTGNVSEGDAKRLAQYSEAATPISLWLESDGGDVSEAIDIGRMVWQRGWTTVVSRDNGRCASACTIIWLSGRHSVVQVDSELIFHSPYDKRTMQRSDEAIRTIAEHLKGMGITERQTWALFTSAPPTGDGLRRNGRRESWDLLGTTSQRPIRLAIVRQNFASRFLEPPPRSRRRPAPGLPRGALEPSAGGDRCTHSKVGLEW